MCGIVGYVGVRQAPQLLWESLSRLEYRGYDSAGIAVLNGTAIVSVKCKGRLRDLKEQLNLLPPATVGIGHTRWATHGAPSNRNAHPHADCAGRIVVVHNGIIENHRELREHLVSRGHSIVSETDTELIAHLIEEKYRGDLVQAVLEAVAELEGSMAIAVLHAGEPRRIVVYRDKSPLIVGLGDNENFVASDIPAILPYTRRAVVLNDGELAEIRDNEVRFYDRSGRSIEKHVIMVDVEPEAAEKAGFDHFMLKEIFEQPEALSRVVSGRIRGDMVSLEPGEFGMTQEEVAAIPKTYLVACGTAYHASLVGKVMFERFAGIHSEAVLASEFRYSEPLVPGGTLCVAVSQSGETADTLAAVREVRRRGARRVLAVVNSPVSSLALEADDVMYQRAGPEIAVASTKAYTTQIVCLALVALHLASQTRNMEPGVISALVREIRTLPEKAQSVLECRDAIKELAREVAVHDDVFFIGRGADYMAAMEGQLKLKEISYIHAEAYAAGELKHGTLALIDNGVPVVAIMTDPMLAAKTASNIMEVKARGGRIIAIGTTECLRYLHQEPGDVFIEIPATHPLLSPVLSVIPMQLLAYYAALERGTDIDKPRNLAKSVTVE